jgi:hypothetical protein
MKRVADEKPADTTAEASAPSPLAPAVESPKELPPLYEKVRQLRQFAADSGRRLVIHGNDEIKVTLILRREHDVVVITDPSWRDLMGEATARGLNVSEDPKANTVTVTLAS